MANDFTSTSSFGFTPGHSFAVAMECKFTEPATPAIVSRTQGIPCSLKALRIFGGSAKVMPQKPQVGAWNHSFWLTEGLFRIYIIGDPANGDAGGGPGSVIILNHILSTTGLDAANLVIPCFWVECGNGAIPVPPDGSAYQMKVEFQGTAEGGGWPFSLELQLAGQWL